MAALDLETLHDVFDAAISAGLSREALLTGIPHELAASLPSVARPAEQVLIDLDALNHIGTLTDGTLPLRIWLMNAEALTGMRREARIFRHALQQIQRQERGEPEEPAARVPNAGESGLERHWGLAERVRRPAPDVAVLFLVVRGKPQMPAFLRDFALRQGVVVEPIVSASELGALLLRHRPSVVHFDAPATDPAAGLVLSDSNGRTATVPPSVLKDIFDQTGRGVQCVVLQRCFHLDQARAVAACVPFVVGSGAPAGDRWMDDFFKTFYQALADGLSIRLALSVGRDTASMSAPGMGDIELIVREGAQLDHVRIA